MSPILLIFLAGLTVLLLLVFFGAVRRGNLRVPGSNGLADADVVDGAMPPEISPVPAPCGPSESLTGLPGRSALSSAFSLMSSGAAPRQPATPLLAYLIADCDHFGSLNATYGTSVGDRVLQALADRVQLAASGMPGARCFHSGADEFVILARGPSFESLSEQARMLHRLCSLPADELGVETLSISIGGACANSGCREDVERLPAQAAAALRRAKQVGSPGMVMYSPLHDAATLAGFDARVARAVLDSVAGTPPILLAYQPIVSCADWSTPYFEVLARLQTKSGVVLPPASFLPVVGFRKLDLEFDLALLRAVRLALAGEAGQALPRGCGVAVNLSVPGLHARETLDFLLDLRRQFPSVPLILEVTEAAFIHDVQLVSQALARLRSAGIRIALDDFGSGFSNLGYLQTLPLDILKFDKTLVHGLGSSRGRVAENMAEAARESGLSLVAEGVETEAQARAMLSAGFTHAQGFFFGKPSLSPVVAAPQLLPSVGQARLEPRAPG